MGLNLGLGMGGLEAPASTGHVVLYEKSTGRILHIHSSVVFRGGQPPTRDALEAVARDQAAGVHGASAHKLPALHVLELDAHASYRVDHKKQCLIEEESKDRPLRRRKAGVPSKQSRARPEKKR